MPAGAGTRDGLLVTLWIIAIIVTTLAAINIDDTLDQFGFYWRAPSRWSRQEPCRSLSFQFFRHHTNGHFRGFTIRFGKASNGMIGSEIAILFLLWCLYLGSSATIAAQWPSSFYCSRFRTYCRTYRATSAWGWISLGLITILFIVDAIGGFDNDSRKNVQAGNTRNVDNVGATSNDPLHSNKTQEALTPAERFEQSGATMA